MRRTYAVIGLGAFGSTVATQLARLGNDVIGIDLNPDLVNDVADHIIQAVVADARDEKVLRDLSVHECDVVVIAIGEDLEANLLATLIVKSMDKPKVWSKALNHNHHQILHKLGTDHIIHPEHEMGLRLANTLIYPEVLDYISLGHDQFTVEVRASERLAGKTLEHLHLPEHHVQCLLVKHEERVMAPADDQYLFQVDDQIVLLGTLGNLRKIIKYL
ncbi:potassium channel family protein [Paraherbaspirillum soli]|uniref:Potassium channel family protein n=1 Tax=Paraherbaspirillum soli TaxID=631222 RepID=A0ABW0MH94_9BURK